MGKAIIVRYAEIHLKGKNRPMFEKALLQNIKSSLVGLDFVLERMHGREVITGYKENDEIEIVERLKCVAGIHSISVCDVVKTDREQIIQLAKNYAKNMSGTFKVRTNRADKTFDMASSEFSALLGEKMLEENELLKVDLVQPENILNVDIREEGKTFVFANTIFGIGGMPVGTAGRGLLLLSGGIDSPVAGFMACKRGVKISAINFESPPYTNDGARQKVLSLAKTLCKYNNEMTVYIVSTTKIQEMIHNKCNREFGITLLRRFMLQISEKIAKRDGLQMLITGESLGQVASQTIESMTTISDAMKTNIPVIKPLICFDKEETVQISKKIGTFETSILPYADCCTVFLPKDPATKPNLKKVIKEEERLDVESLIEEAINNVTVVKVER